MVHQEMQYILAHYKLTDCDCTEPNGSYKMGNDHEEFEVRYVLYCKSWLGHKTHVHVVHFLYIPLYKCACIFSCTVKRVW